MPINLIMMDNLQQRYGKEEGERIYYAMEMERKKKTKHKKK